MNHRMMMDMEGSTDMGNNMSNNNNMGMDHGSGMMMGMNMWIYASPKGDFYYLSKDWFVSR